ncbi:MAG TPA: peptide ABC transporter substrate-binding protein [Candidatus Dormibacteraeota bacterium]|nr:peptide ABC transporter substrate-binding protein [Candidatus Dormibacteraeota bacterium]
MHLGFRLRAIALAAAGVCIAAACGGGNGSSGTNAAPPDKQVLNVNIDTEPSTLDPTQEQWVYEADAGRNMYEALTRANAADTDVVGAAASSWDVSSDGLTWTFHLRSDGKYSDGHPVVASDFVASYKRILDPTIAAPYADPFFDGNIAGAQDYGNVDAKNPAAVKSFLDGIGVSATDDKTFVIKLQKAAPYFKWVTSLWMASPIEASDLAAGGANFGAVTADAPTKIHGNGPYMLSEIVPKDHITLVPNKSYRTQPMLQKVNLLEITDANVEFAKFQNGELDITRGVPPLDVATVNGDPKLSKEVVKGPSLLTWWIDFNTTKAPFNNKNLRVAFSKSLDRASYVHNILKDVGTPITSMIPNGMQPFDSAAGPQGYDCTAAKAALAQAKTDGVTDAQLNSIHYEYANSSTRKTSSEFFQQQWQSCLGINVTLDAIDSQTHSHHLRSGNYQIGGVSGWQADYPDGQDWFDIFITGSGNQFSNWSNSQYDALVQKGDTAPKTADRIAAYTQAQTILEQEAPVMFLFQNEKFFLMSSKVKGATVHPLDDDWAGDIATTTSMYISA